MQQRSSAQKCERGLKRFCPLVVSGKKKSTYLNFWVRIFSGGVGVFHVNWWGPKSQVTLNNSLGGKAATPDQPVWLL